MTKQWITARRIGGTLFAALALQGLLYAAEYRVSPADRSTLVATFRQEGVSVDSPFTRFSGRISYDAANVAAATAEIDVDLASLDIGDPAYLAELAKKAWFDTAAHPKATFRSTKVTPGANGGFQAAGTLTIKGKAQAVTVPVTVSRVPAGQVFEGSFPISRKAFGIGDPVWDDVLEDRVVVKFRIQGGAPGAAR